MTKTNDPVPPTDNLPQAEQTPLSPPPPVPIPPLPQKPKRGRPKNEVTPEEREEILNLKRFYKIRSIAKRTGKSRKIVTRVLAEEGLWEAAWTESQSPETGSKLDLYSAAIAQRVRMDLTVTRIYREITALGYQGGRTILAEHVRTLRTELALSSHKPAVKRRFETRSGLEMQIDWSPYIITIGGKQVPVRAFGCLLGFSRKLFLQIYRDERQSTLLQALLAAFIYFAGVATRIVLDNMATAILGRIGPNRKELWHPRFLDFCRYYGFSAFACKVRDPDRKGKKEKSFRLVWDDFLKGTAFDSWEDLHERTRLWLDHTPQVGNLRVHGTTRRIPNEAFLEEQPLLIRLPEDRSFPVHDQEVRVVDRDATLSIFGTRYTVPWTLANRSVAVRLFVDHFEVLDPLGRIALSRAYVPEAQKGTLQIDQTHYATLPRRPAGDGGSRDRIDEAFRKRFPALAPLVDGLKLRMKTLAPIHIRALVRLCDRYGEEAFLAAADRAQQYRRFDANAVKRILEQAHPLPDEDHVAPLSGRGPAVVGEVDPPSFEGFAHLDTCPTTKNNPEDNHGS